MELDADVAGAFFRLLREQHGGNVVCEPRHPSWFTPESENLLAEFRIARVAADPSVVPAAAQPGGWSGVAYYRLHGSPEMYVSAYSESYLDALAKRLKRAAQTTSVWCIFDNTASGAATANALALMDRLRGETLRNKPGGGWV